MINKANHLPYNHQRLTVDLRKQGRRYHAVVAAIVAVLLLAGCGSSMSDDEKEIAIAVALTQTAAAVDVPSTPTPETANSEAAAPVESSATPVPVDPTATAAEVVAAEDDTTASSGPTLVPVMEPLPAEEAEPAALTADSLPVTQNNLKVRTLLVAPGEPGRLYALLTDEAIATAPATGARLLTSENFGDNWSDFAGGLPVDAACLMNVNMDYYGATALYASTCQGIYRWAPGDSAWIQVASDETGMVAVVYGNDDILWATRPFQPEGAPVILSQNGGESWTEIGMMHFNGVATVGISPRDSQNGYAIIWPEYAGSYLRRGSMFSEWEEMPTPNNNAVINTGMTIDGGTGWLYVTTTDSSGNGLWRSANPDTPLVEDVNWELLHQFAPDLTAELLASGWSPEDKQLAIYANLSTIVDGKQHFTLVRSLDSGKTWQPLVVDAG